MFARPLQLLAVAAVLALALLISNARAAGGGPELPYVVEPGDTLWSIAAERYGGDHAKGCGDSRSETGWRRPLTPGMVLVVPP